MQNLYWPVLPGRPILGIMQGYGQFCPVAKAAEILTERWTPLLLREFVLGSHRFNDLHRGLPLMSRSLLAALAAFTAAVAADMVSNRSPMSRTASGRSAWKASANPPIARPVACATASGVSSVGSASTVADASNRSDT